MTPITTVEGTLLTVAAIPPDGGQPGAVLLISTAADGAVANVVLPVADAEALGQALLDAARQAKR